MKHRSNQFISKSIRNHQKTDDFSSDQADQPWEIAEVRRKEIPLHPPPLLQETQCRRNSGGAHTPPTAILSPYKRPSSA